MTSLYRFLIHHGPQALMPVVLALFLVSCGAAASGGPNTAMPATAQATFQPTQAPATTATQQIAATPTQIPATATALPTKKPTATVVPTKKPIATAVPTQKPTATPNAPATALPTQIPTPAPPIVPTVSAATATVVVPPPVAGPGMILFLRNGNLWAVDDKGIAERQLAEGVVDFAPSANGRSIALLRGKGRAAEIWLINGDGTGLRQLTRNDRAEARLSWAADGTALVTGSAATDEPYARDWLAWSAWCNQAEVHIVDIQTGAETSLAAGCDPAFAPDSKRIAYSAPPAGLAPGFPQDGPRVGNSIRLINRLGKNGWNFAVADGGPERGGLVVYAPAWAPDSSQVVYHRYMGMQVEVDINMTEMGRSFEGKGKAIAEGAGWMMPARFSETGDRVVLVKHDYGNARGLIGAGAWSLEVIGLQGSREIAMPSGPIQVIGQSMGRLGGAQAAAWAPGSQALAVLLPAGWTEDGDPEAWGTQPGEIRRWVPGQAPSQVLAKQVDYASPIAWIAMR